MRLNHFQRRITSRSLWVLAQACVPLLFGVPVVAQTPRSLLPDLVPLADEARGYVHGWTIDSSTSRTLLRLSTAIANFGEGAMDLRGGAIQHHGAQEVFQRIYNDAGTFQDQLAGTFIYHPTHNHVHFDGFAQYTLREVLPNDKVGDVVASGEKVSFCLLDVDNIDPAFVGSPEIQIYERCTANSQGISVGWADVYEEGLPDQWIDVTDIPYSQYWLEVIVDPDNQLQELDESNNTARMRIDYSSVVPLTRDRFEPNDGGDRFARLPSAVTMHNRLSIHAPGNDDNYVWQAPRSGVLTAEMQFDRGEGDANLFMYDITPFELIGLGIGTGNSERFAVPVVSGKEYGFRVIGAGDDVISNYSLALSVGDEQIVHPKDSLESNDFLSNASRLTAPDVEIAGLSIHSVIDVDYFRWTAPRTGTLDVSLAFSLAEGDLGLSLLKPQLDTY